MSKVIGFTINIQGSQDAVNAAEELRRKIAEVQKALRATSDQSDVQKLGNYLIDLKAQQAEVNKVIRDQIKLRQQEIREATKTKDTYSDLSARLNTLRNRYKDMAAAQEESTDEAKALLKEVQELDKRLKDIDSSVGQFQRNVGNYGSASVRKLMDSEIEQDVPILDVTRDDLSAGMFFRASDPRSWIGASEMALVFKYIDAQKEESCD